MSNLARSRGVTFRKILTILILLSLIPVAFSAFLTISTYQGFISSFGDESVFTNPEAVQLKQDILIQIFLILFLLVILIVFASSLVAYGITRPLTVLVEGVKQVAVGNYNIRFKIKSKDEFGELAVAFNEMIVRLKKTDTKIKQQYQEVHEKTIELEDTQKALINMLEDAEESRAQIESERNKTTAVINSFTDGILFFDGDNRLSLINPRAESFFGIDSRKLLNLHILELKPFILIKPLVLFLGENIKKVFREELSIGEELNLEVSTIPIMERKEKKGTLVVLHDVTREKLIDKLKSEFISVVAHQLRTPLSSVKWILKMTLDGDVGEISTQQRDFLLKGYTANERMIHLVNDLLDVSRVEEGKFGLKISVHDLGKTLTRVVSSFEQQLNARNIKLEYISPPHPFLIKFDDERMEMVLSNLIDNAIRYTPTGGNVIVSVEMEKEFIKVSIKDTGAGIPKNQKNRVFSKFFRGDNVVKMQTEGTGLGLYLCKNIVEGHHGKIWFESEEGKGSTFYFTLPK